MKPKLRLPDIKWPEIKFKSPLTIIVLLFLGLVSIVSYFAPLVWEEWQHVERLKAERAALNLYITNGQQQLDSEEKHPQTPLDKDTLIRLQEQLPVAEEIPRFIVQLSTAASSAGVTLNGLHVARSAGELDARMAEPGLLKEEGTEREPDDFPDQETAKEKEGERSDLLQFDREPVSKEQGVTDKTETGLHKFWADVYLQGSYSSLTNFFSQLEQQPRITEVVEWRYVLPKEDTPSHIRIRLNVMYYEDNRLAELPTLPEPNISSSGGPEIDVLPEEPPPPEEEEERDDDSLDPRDLPFFIPYPLVPKEDGTGFEPYEWEPGQKPEKEDEGQSPADTHLRGGNTISPGSGKTGNIEDTGEDVDGTAR